MSDMSDTGKIDSIRAGMVLPSRSSDAEKLGPRVESWIYSDNRCERSEVNTKSMLTLSKHSWLNLATKDIYTGSEA